MEYSCGTLISNSIQLTHTCIVRHYGNNRIRSFIGQEQPGKTVTTQKWTTFCLIQFGDNLTNFTVCSVFL